MNNKIEISIFSNPLQTHFQSITGRIILKFNIFESLSNTSPRSPWLQYRQSTPEAHSLASDPYVGGVERDEVGVTDVYLVHAVAHARTADTVEIRFEVLRCEGHDHVLTLLHLVVGDDAPARLRLRAHVEDEQATTMLHT